MNSKLITQNVKLKVSLLLFVLCNIFAICVFSLVLISNSYALDLDKLKSSFLSGDYKAVIQEGEKILAMQPGSGDLDELYLILGRSYLKDGNLLRAADIFQIIIKEYKNSKFEDEAKLSLGDTYFLRQDFSRAEIAYNDIIKANPGTKLKADLYYRLSQVKLKQGDTKAAKDYLSKLKQEFPLSTQLSLDQDLKLLVEEPVTDFYYSVQVGSFSNSVNANNLVRRLLDKGYSAYLEKVIFQGKTTYRVKVGKTSQRQEIVALDNKLSKEGYPTKIFP